ncbi:NAD(+)--dinitrogen-reductase ADP-D-ribosyltransferase [Candidatus Magnetaquicoccus inordinatus]|uniref:NAD(+)--dinitrogen-reductase ADP-D-ribosyltransferase n=1 Tax=Candidatus Magnetaquicoccus inordinatus TaxID=2496818 RepID=UPI001D0F1F66|nr:NAD(+)--dinitrogen-reductase ADP-D-ribosyltransferase [Candidatus Magnetaquicoccus inordinatus]
MRQQVNNCLEMDKRKDWPVFAESRLLFNRCNLPSWVLGSLSFQRHPQALQLDGVQEIHADLFRRLQTLPQAEQRMQQFMDYMVVYFALQSPEQAGFHAGIRIRRNKADYLRMLRGWLFDADSREGAVLKGWVASRFGLLPRYHAGPLADQEGESYRHYLQMQSAGLYNTHALEGQLDLVFGYCQYELAQRHPQQTHLCLYRGINKIGSHDIVERLQGNRLWVLLNNLNSFTSNRERAEEFGDAVLQVEVPISKIFFFNSLLPGILKGEEEYMVIGGMYEVQQLRHPL